MLTKNNLICLLFLLFPVLVFAQQDSIKATEIAEVKVYANPSPRALKALARVVEIVSSKELQASASNTIEGVLRESTTVDIQNRGTNAQTDIAIRGGSFDQTLLMVNGIAINDPQTGHMNMNLMFDKDAIKQIEILKGSGSKMFGANAFSGAINFVIDPAKQNTIKLKTGYADFNTFNYGVTLNNSYKSWNTTLSVNHKKSDGYIYNTATASTQLFLLSQGKLGEAKLSFIYGFNDNAFGANSFYHWASKEQWENIKSQLSALKISFGERIKNNAQIYWKRNYDKYIWKPIYPANLHRTDIYGFKNTLILNKNLTFLLDIKREKMLSNSMGLALDDVVAVPKESDQYYTKGVVRTNATFSANYHYSKNSFNLASGLNINYNSAFDFNLASGIELAKKFKQFSPYIAINTAYRLPTFFDLYYNSSSNEGNPDLKPEQAITYETGVKYNNNFVQGTFSIFSKAGKNIIDWARPMNNTTAKYRSQNIAQLTTYGAELGLKVYPKRKWNHSKINYINLTSIWLDQNKALDGQLSKYAFVYLKQSVNLTINHQIMKHLAATWSLQYRNRSGHYATYETGTVTDFKPYLLANFKLNYSLKKLNIFASLDNISNQAYYNTGSLPQAGRWFGLGLNYKITY